MADDPAKTDPPADPKDNGKDEAETAFWTKLKSEIGSILDEKLKDRAKADPPATGTSRTGAKPVTIKSLISDLVYGPPKD
jgi:hypothetical protein